MEEQPDKNLEKPIIVSSDKKALDKRMATIYISGCALILIVILIIVFWPRHNSKTVFTINGTAYNQAYIDPIASFPIKQLGEPANTEYKLILNMLEYKTVATNLGILPSNSQINIQQASLNQTYSGFITLESYKTWSRLVALDLAIQNELNTQYNNGYYAGYSYIFWFGNTIDGGPAYTPSNEGNTTIYNQDKNYALDQANYYYEELKTNKMTEQQAYQAISANSRLMVNSKINQTVHFGTNNSIPWTEQVYYPQIVNYISSQHQLGLSSIKVGTITLQDPAVTNPDAYYYIVKVDKVGTSTSIFRDDLTLLKVKYYGVSS